MTGKHLGVLLLALAFLLHFPKDASSTRTNFVILLADDLGYGDVSFNGGVTPTPNLDALAYSDSSILFKNYHASALICSPSRASVLAGQNAERTCVIGVNSEIQTFLPRENMSTIAMDAKLLNYTTAFFGKWHLGTFQQNPPENGGFDFWVGSVQNIPTFDPNCFCPEQACHEECTRGSCVPLFRKSLKCVSPLTKNECVLGSWKSMWLRDSWECFMNQGGLEGPGVFATIPKEMSCTYLAARFDEFVKSLPSTTPIFSLISFNEPHIPYISDPVQMSRTEQVLANIGHPVAPNSKFANYYGVLQSLDLAVRQIHQTLNDTNRLENTFLVFYSDNGPELLSLGGSGSARPLRGMKRSLFEGGHRSAAFLHWPARIQKNYILQHSHVQALDLRPTIEDILNEENPGIANFVVNREELDGETILPLIKSPETWVRNSSVILCKAWEQGNYGVCTSYAYFEGNYKTIVVRGKEMNKRTSMLYNFVDDISETQNLVNMDSALFDSMVTKGIAKVTNLVGYYEANCQGTHPANKKHTRGSKGAHKRHGRKK